MAQSRYKKLLKTETKADTGVGVGGSVTTLTLNKDYLVSEYAFYVEVTQAIAGGGAASCDVRNFIASMEFEVSGGYASGKRFTMDGAQIYDHSRFAESQPAPVVDLAAASAVYSFEWHAANDEALNDLHTAIRTGDYSSIKVRITWAPDATNGFVGGGARGAAAYKVTAEAHAYPTMTPLTVADKARVPQGSEYHACDSQPAAFAGAGDQPDIKLKCGNKTRFLMIHTKNAAGAFDDGVIGNITLPLGAITVRDVSFTTLKQRTAKTRSALAGVVGVAVIDFGDDEDGWLDLSQVNECKLKYSALKAGSVTFLQDFTAK